MNSKSYSAACTVKVSAPSISLSSSSLSLTAGDTCTLTASVTPSGQSVTWSSSSSSVATVSSSGKVTAISAGSTTITATINGTSYKASCTVTVTAAASTLGFVNMNLPYSGAVSSNYDINKIEYYLLRNGDEINHGTLGGGLGTYWDLQGLINLMMKYATSSGTYTMGFYVYDSSGEEAGYGKAFNIE
ncbi:MAG: Ig-like domain-containing protein [Lachnospiraceae bacterium]|nr:Ig-like domain-containing protein [Lachnospiraceae bacterium]